MSEVEYDVVPVRGVGYDNSQHFGEDGEKYHREHSEEREGVHLIIKMNINLLSTYQEVEISALVNPPLPIVYLPPALEEDEDDDEDIEDIDQELVYSLDLQSEILVDRQFPKGVVYNEPGELTLDELKRMQNSKSHSIRPLRRPETSECIWTSVTKDCLKCVRNRVGVHPEEWRIRARLPQMLES